MSHLIKAIFWLLLTLLMIFCCVIDVINQNWLAFIVCALAFVFDSAQTFVAFSAWAREQGKKDARKTKEEITE